MKNVLVFGGTRFFGVHLVNCLIAAGYSVTIATRGQSSDNFKDKVNRITLDRQDEESLEVNLANKHYDIIYDNIAFSANDLEILFKYVSFDRYIVTSTSAVYRPLSNFVSESDFNPHTYPFTHHFSNNVEYGEGKKSVETYLSQKCPDINYAIVRIPYVLGLDDYTLRLDKYIDSLVNDKPLYIDNLYHQFSFINANEAGKFLAYLAESEFKGEINGASYNPISLYQMLDYSCLKLGYNTNKKIKELYLNKDNPKAPYNGQSAISYDTSLASSIGFAFSNIETWIYPLINELIKRYQ